MATFLPWNLASSFSDFCIVFSSPKLWSEAVSEWIAGSYLFTTFCQLLGKQLCLPIRCLFKLGREKAKATHNHGSPNTSYVILQVECRNERSFALYGCVCIWVCFVCVFSLHFFVWQDILKIFSKQGRKIILIMAVQNSYIINALDMWFVYSSLPFPITDL